MRRVLFTIAASVAVFAFVPASAMARKHHRHHHHHHHVRTHSRVHKFGQFSPPGSTGTPTTPGQTAGTVTSFDPTTGTLVITLNDGTTTESGIVTSETEIECQAPESSPTMGEEGDGGSSGGGDNQGGQSGGGEDNGGDGGDDQGEDQGNQNCSTANLTPGAVVLGAELQIDSSGAVWDKIELM